MKEPREEREGDLLLFCPFRVIRKPIRSILTLLEYVREFASISCLGCMQPLRRALLRSLRK